MVYLIKDDIMHIKEMIYLNREAQEGLWGYIRAHDSMIDEVHGNSYFGEPIAFELDDGDIRETIRPYIMGRIVDVEQFFSKYRCDSSAETAEISFEVEDEFLPWNDKTFNLRFSGGECSIIPGEAAHRAKMTVATLTTMLFGYKTAAKLYRLGRIDADEETVRILDDVLLHEEPYISDYI